MGRIKKAATERHNTTLSQLVEKFVKQATEVPLHRLPALLDDFPQQWPLPRGDLYHWIPLLDRFDHVLELFVKEYALNEGPQTQPFGRRVLQKGDAEEGQPYPSSGAQSQDLDAAGYSEEGDRELVESVVHFTRILLERCGNRSLYESSPHINHLLHTTSLSLLRLCLKLSLRLAQRYQVARLKNQHSSAQPLLLASHYDISLDNVHRMAMPFPKPLAAGPTSTVSGKGKDKLQASNFNPSDLVAIAKTPMPSSSRTDLAGVSITYYENPASNARPGPLSQPSESSPTTPTPARRTSNLGPARDRPSAGERSTSAGDVSEAAVKSKEPEDSSPTAPKSYQIPASEVAETPAWSLMKSALPQVPSEMHFDLLNRVRIAKAFACSDLESQQLLLEIRLLAIANLAYAYSEAKFYEKVGTPDSEEPCRFQLAQQLCDLLQPSTSGQQSLTLQTETTVLVTLEALAKSKYKVSDVADALSVQANHGLLYYELRKVIATLHAEPHADKKLELSETDWREAAFDLTSSLQHNNSHTRNAEHMVNAGIMAILLEVLCLRTHRAERFQEKVLLFFDAFTHGISTAFQTLANIKGLDAIADLTAYSVDLALTNSSNGNGLPPDYKCKVVDYDLPYFQQATLRQVFKTMGRMFDQNSGTHDRLLRNMIDTPQILGALRTVIEHARVFGSNVWSGAVNILSSFIHHEPTSYQVVGEAGLTKSLLESITGEKLPDESTPVDEPAANPEESAPVDEPAAHPKVEYYHATSATYTGSPPAYCSESSILPVGEVMCDIPTAFGAICLNESGMKLFQASGALAKYMDIFLSIKHVRTMEEENQVANAIGQTFDELSRHHPRLKDQIMAAVIDMVRRVRDLCHAIAGYEQSGAKLWERSEDTFCISGGEAALVGDTAKNFGRSPASESEPDRLTGDKPVLDCNSQEPRERARALSYLSACFKFLEGFFHNNSVCAAFCEQGGAELVLDLATSPSNPYDFVAFAVFSKVAQVVKALCEARAHLVLPSLVRRVQHSAAGLKFLTEVDGTTSSFVGFTTLADPQQALFPNGVDGTGVAKLLLNAHVLAHILGRTLAPPPYQLRHGHQSNQIFTALNFTDVYIELVENLSRLHAACLWEHLLLQRALSEEAKNDSDPRAFVMRRVDKDGIVEVAGTKQQVDAPTPKEQAVGDQVDTNNDRLAVYTGRNTKAIRYLLGQAPMGIESFFHSLGQAILTKRSENGPKQHAHVVADCLARSIIWELDHRRKDITEETETKYVALLLTMIGRTILKNSYSMETIGTKEALVLVLNRFYIAGGFDKFNDYLRRFVTQLGSQDESDTVAASSARDAVHSILGFYHSVVRSRCINDASQTAALARDPRSTSSLEYFSSSQLLVEVRDAVITAVTDLWQSEDIEKFSEHNTRSIVDIMRLILKGEGEERAIRRVEHARRHAFATKPEFKIRSQEGFARLKELGFDASLAWEALYRCSNHPQNSEAYCRLRQRDPQVARFPIPAGEPAPPDSESSSRPALQPEGEAVPEEQDAVDPEDADAMDTADTGDVDEEPTGESEANSSADEDEAMSEDADLGTLGALPQHLLDADLQAMVSQRDASILADRSTPKDEAAAVDDTRKLFVTVDDLDEKRQLLRDQLIDRCLDVLSSQPNLTFELADLIQAAVAKAGEGANPRAEIGTTLISSLVSLQAEEPSKETETKIQAYAHLVALILQDRDFFDSTVEELKDYFDTLVGWVQSASEQKVEDLPWVEMIILIIERVLAEDEQPAQVTWAPPPAEDPLKAQPEIVATPRLVSDELRSQLFDALVEILPKIGKNTSLALSVSRVLVVLTRKRDLALRLGEKPTMGRLFLMVRQLAGTAGDRIQGSFMLILRHIIEDDDTVRQIMRAEIQTVFENHNVRSRSMDTASYTRNLSHLVLRNSEVFVEVTQELLEIPHYDGHQRAQILGRKKPITAPQIEAPSEVPPPPETNPEEEQAPKSTEPKAPTVESSDGVIQFLLRELSNYKDVEDQSAPPAAKDTQENSAAQASDSASTDIQMTDAAPVNSAVGRPLGDGKVAKHAFKAEDHVIYIYRCFLLQCLAEVLACYNRTKVEFINYSRKSDLQPATPSKPRSGTLNYLMNILLPVGTLEHRDDVTHRKKMATSNWAINVLVSLCSKTNEHQTPGWTASDPNSLSDTEPELNFVRKFVLDHALRAFKEATSSAEPLALRYSRLLALGELFNRMLNGKTEVQRAGAAHAYNYAAQQQVGRQMYEKGFIAVLTSAIAELDLNFPNAKRTVKYILGPLKQLTELGVTLSQDPSVSSTGPNTSADEDEVSSATSISEDEELDREQTPDLFRGSSLGMFENGGGEDNESDSEDEEDEDEEMYDDGYEEEMEYEEDPEPEHGGVVSDEDEDFPGMGEVEGVPGGGPIEIDIRMDDDGDSDDEDISVDDDEEDEEDDIDEEIEFANDMDEITGEDENGSMGEHDDEEDWEDDGANLEGGALEDEGSLHGGPLDHIAHIIGGGNPEDPEDPDRVGHLDIGDDEEVYFDDEMAPEDEDEEDEEIDLDNNVVYEPEHEDEEDEEFEAAWEGYAPPPPGAVRGALHHHRHGLNEMIDMMEPMRTGFRTHRAAPVVREEDGVNPLLQREGAAGSSNRERDLDRTSPANRRHVLPRPAGDFLQNIVQAVGPPGHGGAGIINVSVDGLHGGLAHLPPIFAVQGRNGGHAIMGLDPTRPWREQLNIPRGWDLQHGRATEQRGGATTEEASAVNFHATSTMSRWQEEMRQLFPGKYHEKATRILNMLMRTLVPAAMEAKRLRDIAEREAREAREKAAAEARKKAEAEAAEREAQEKKEREEREVKEREEVEAARARQQAEREARGEEAKTDPEPSAMEDIEQQTPAATADASSEAPENETAPTERVTINIRGRPLDITDLGIDREYIEALPEDMREEVVMAQFAEQRQQAAQSGAGPSDISREFLDALPPEIQAELLRSEASERRRRERDETRRQAAQQGGAAAAPAQPEDMNNLDFMATLDPVLRQAVLMDAGADDAALAHLPEELQAEARALFGDQRLPRGLDQVGRLARGLDPVQALHGQMPDPRAYEPTGEVSRQRRPVAQMLDKSGIATLLRLMFVSLNQKAKTNLHGILSDVCKNTQNRAEVISILLSILQDGTGDVNAVERSFAQLSLRAKQTSAPKTPQPPKRSLTNQANISPSTDLSPLNIVQQCLATLNALSIGNARVPSFFLNEHETISSQKAKTVKKGKGRESKAAKFPLNALLTLLDRKLITDNTAVMETLASLLSQVTHPLTILLRRAKEAQEAEKAEAEKTEESDERPPTGTSDVVMGEASTADFTTEAPGSSSVQPESIEVPGAETAEPAKEEPKKKHHDLTPPEVPEENIRLVVNIVAARECPRKTFMDTLDIIKNLSAIPGSREVFGKELIRQAQELGQTLLEDLDELNKQIESAETGTEIQGMALANFSSAGSKQRKLLRVLVALDHLFDPKRVQSLQPSSVETQGADQKLKEDILATFYDSSTFEKLWDNLGVTLSAIQRRGDMINVANILLPLVESLMVVCRNSALKEAPTTAADTSVGTPPPAENRMDKLFFSFTEEHRKVLNELIRNNPKLMNGNLAVLAKNSKVLEFDNKRSYFSRQLHDRRSEARVAHPSLQLNVRRSEVFLDSFKHLYFKTGNEIKYGKLNIRFHGEEGVDAGGVSREWFAALARQMFDGNYALFNPVASDRTTFHPNTLSYINKEHLMFFKFVGRIIGKALYENRVLDCHFSRAVYRRILGKSVSLKDMESLDLDYYKSLVWILENDITDVTFETFSVDVDHFGVIETHDLIPKGRDIAVTEENKQEYVRLVVEYRLIGSVKDQLNEFLVGFHEIIPSELICIFNEQELELLISGLPEIDVDDWKNNTEYHNYQATSSQIQWFWRAIRSFDKEEKAKLLQFVTGTSKVPLNGFKELEGMNGFSKFNIHRDYSSKEKLPSSHTCFNQLDLPEYESYEHLRHQLYTAITAGSEYFGFA